MLLLVAPSALHTLARCSWVSQAEAGLCGLLILTVPLSSVCYCS